MVYQIFTNKKPQKNIGLIYRNEGMKM